MLLDLTLRGAGVYRNSMNRRILVERNDKSIRNTMHRWWVDKCEARLKDPGHWALSLLHLHGRNREPVMSDDKWREVVIRNHNRLSGRRNVRAVMVIKNTDTCPHLTRASGLLQVREHGCESSWFWTFQPCWSFGFYMFGQPDILSGLYLQQPLHIQMPPLKAIHTFRDGL